MTKNIQISDYDFLASIRALTRFWGLADRECGGVIDIPY